MRGDDGRVGGVQGVGGFVDEGDREVVGRLVRQQGVRPGRRRQGEVRAALPARRQVGHRLVGVP
ncbi:hypothetical protein [Streptomyces sp. NPDC002324]